MVVYVFTYQGPVCIIHLIVERFVFGKLSLDNLWWFKQRLPWSWENGSKIKKQIHILALIQVFLTTVSNRCSSLEPNFPQPILYYTNIIVTTILILYYTYTVLYFPKKIMKFQLKKLWNGAWKLKWQIRDALYINVIRAQNFRCPSFIWNILKIPSSRKNILKC